jgi:hypothetical protein
MRGERVSNEIKQILRVQAWERAMGELRSIRHTYLSSIDLGDKGKLVEFDNAFNEFVDKISDNGIV